MEYPDSIQVTLDFIDRHIKSNITTEDLARAALMSVPQLYKLFGRYCHCTPMKYIQKRRLYLAAKDLIGKERRIIDVALEYGFNSHDVFTRAFRRTYGVNPEYYRRFGYCLPDFSITLSENKYEDGNAMHDVEIVTFPKTHLIGVENRLHIDEWAPDVFHKMYETVFKHAPNLVHPPADCSQHPYTCATHILSILQANGSYHYFAGVAVTDFSNLPKAEGIVTRTIPETMCAMIGYKGGLDFKVIVDHLYGQWLGSHLFIPSNNADNPYCPIEWYSPVGFDVYEERIYMPIQPISYDIQKVEECNGIVCKAYSSDRAKAKSMAFDTMLQWARDNDLFVTQPVKLEVRYGNMADETYYCEICYKANGRLSEFSHNDSITEKTYPGGLYATAHFVHGFLEQQERIFMRMLGQSHKYAMIGGCHEEFILDKPTVDHFTRVNFYEGIQRKP